MRVLTDLEYLKLTRIQKIGYRILLFFYLIPSRFGKLAKKVGEKIKNLALKIWSELKDIVNTFIHGSWITKLSYVFMGFGNLMRGQVVRGILFFIFELAFILYMALFGGHWLGKLHLDPNRLTATKLEYDPVLDTNVQVPGDNSFKIILYSLITLFFILAFVYTWRVNVKQNRIAEEILASGKKLKSGKDDLKSIVDDQFHKTLLALPTTGMMIFTVMPIVFMILVAFTNYDGAHSGYPNLFEWVGLDNFNQLVATSTSDGNLGFTFGEILLWTLVWAFFATFTNYFLGMFVAMMINKKGIRLKKLWRGILVLTIAIPQFISLLYISKMFSYNGIINGLLIDWGWITTPIQFWNNPNPAVPRMLVIIINIWIGIPYLMLISTGILMNIPQDLYESAKIDGANAVQQFGRITFPYMLFVTGPYLLTSFVNNLNNFNVIYLLTNGEVMPNPDYLTDAGSATNTDLLVTWLFNITQGAEAKYNLAAVIAILIFVVVAGLSLVVYNVIPSTRNEEDFQ